MAVQTKKKTSRNAPCPCGSGKKFKRCCLLQQGNSEPPDVGFPAQPKLLGPRFVNRLATGSNSVPRNRIATWKRVFCQVPLQNGAFRVLTLGYTSEFVNRISLRSGAFIELDLEEIDFRGQAFIIAIQDTRAPATRNGELLLVMDRQHPGDFGIIVYGKGPLAKEMLERRRERSREIVLVMEKPDGGRVDITLVRFVEWIEAHGAEVGKEIFLDLPHMAARGFAQVVEINPCPEFEPDDTVDAHSRFVTGTFRHSSGEVYDLKLASESKPIGVTATHPFWSVDRKDWVSAQDLRIGETLETMKGVTHVESFTKRPEPEPVYNLEVEGDHVYRVGESGVLVHNSSAPDCPASRVKDALTDSLGNSPFCVPSRGHHIFPVSEFDSPLGLKLCEWGIKLDSADNGVWLPYCDYEGRTASVHRGGNTNAYIDYVTGQLAVAENKAQALAIIDKIRQKLLNGTLKINNADEHKPC